MSEGSRLPSRRVTNGHSAWARRCCEDAAKEPRSLGKEWMAKPGIYADLAAPDARNTTLPTPSLPVVSCIARVAPIHMTTPFTHQRRLQTTRRMR